LATDLLKQAVARVPQAKVRILVWRYINSIHVNSISKHEHPFKVKHWEVPVSKHLYFVSSYHC
jgi:hypothetical protein